MKIQICTHYPWALKKNESLNHAAKRTLLERIGIENIYFEQFYTFGDIERHDPEPFKIILKGKGYLALSDYCLFERFLRVGYYALIDYSKAVPIPDFLADKCEWHDLKKLPTLLLDHTQIVNKALHTLRANIDNQLIGFNLMPETFTLDDLQRLYETVLGKKFLRASFQRKMLNLEILEQNDRKFTGAAKKAPYLYKFTRNGK